MSRWNRYEKTKGEMERDAGSTAVGGVNGDLYRVKTGAGEGTEMSVNRICSTVGVDMRPASLCGALTAGDRACRM